MSDTCHHWESWQCPTVRRWSFRRPPGGRFTNHNTR